MSVRDDEQAYYICGRCHSQQFYLLLASPNSPCDVCGYLGFDKPYTSLPTQIRMDLNQY